MDSISSLMLQGGWRKGPWTALEDRLLTEYVQQQGEGSWNSVAKLTGTYVLSSPPEPDHQAVMAMMNNLQSGPVPEQYFALPADDDALLWDSLWRLVDGDSCSAGEGSSGGEY
ncbi:hypothetical protein EJB05_08054, partial [Eragrostis curvula]